MRLIFADSSARIFAVICGVLALSGCGGTVRTDGTVGTGGDSPVVESSVGAVTGVDLWVRMPAVGQTVAAAYGHITNGTEREVTVKSVRSALGRAELHETTGDAQGVMRMRERTDGFVLAPGSTLTFEPGGAHVMVFDVDMLGLRLAQTVNLEFEIIGWGPLEISAPVRELDHSDDSDHGDHMTGVAGEALDVSALHRLDDELHAGIFDPETQRQVVADALATAGVAEFPADFDRDALISALENLDNALIAGEVRTAAEWAFIVHDLAHALEPLHSH